MLLTRVLLFSDKLDPTMEFDIIGSAVDMQPKAASENTTGANNALPEVSEGAWMFCKEYTLRTFADWYLPWTWMKLPCSAVYYIKVFAYVY